MTPELGPLFELVRDAVLVADRATGRIVQLNRAAAALFGESPSGRLAELLPAEVDHAAEGVQYVHLSTGKTRRADGTEIVVEAQRFDLDDIHEVAIVRDVTAQRTLERERASFVAAVSHDLKSPLAAISGQAQLLQRRLTQLELPDAATMIRRLARIDETTLRMARLIDDLLDVSRLQMGRRLELNLQDVDLVELVRGSFQQLQTNLPGHRFSVDTTEAAVIGQWDPVRVGRVVDGLLGSAVKRSPSGGDVVLSIVRDDGSAVLSVPAGEVASISRQIVEQHGGSIAQTGAIVAVRLPLQPGGGA